LTNWTKDGISIIGFAPMGGACHWLQYGHNCNCFEFLKDTKREGELLRGKIVPIGHIGHLTHASW